MITLGGRLKALREKRNLAQREISEGTGISRDRIGYIENDKTQLKANEIIKLAHFFQVSINWLLLGTIKNDEEEAPNEEVEEPLQKDISKDEIEIDMQAIQNMPTDKQLQIAIGIMKKLESETLQRTINYVMQEYFNELNTNNPTKSIFFNGFLFDESFFRPKL